MNTILVEHLEWQENCMKNNSKKIVLFIVEGKSEEMALGPILSKIISTNLVKFKVLNGDITSDYYNVTQQNILKKIKEHIKNFMGNIYRIEDIQEIIHIVDLDGSFIADDKITYKNVESVIYNDLNIETKHVDEIKQRNIFKSSILNFLAHITSIKLGRNTNNKKPYSLFYMSCNLDHVIHDERNLQSCLKISKAVEFSDKYYNEKTKFYHYMKSKNILKADNYTESWLHVQNGLNSLSKCSNFSLYLDKYFSGDHTEDNEQ